MRVIFFPLFVLYLVSLDYRTLAPKSSARSVMLLTPLATVGIEATLAMILVAVLAPHRRGNVVAQRAVVQVELCEGSVELLLE